MMNVPNIILSLIVTTLLGISIGLYISPLKTPPLTEDEIFEQYQLVGSLRVEMQKMLLDFYINDYCENENTRIIGYNYNGTYFDGMYCDKNAVLILGSGFPPLPILIMRVEDET